MNEEMGRLEPLFLWFEATSIATAIQESIWAFPIIEAAHLLSLCLLGGAVLVVDLRMLGLGMTGTRISTLARYARPWLILAVVLLIGTGVPLLLSEAIKAYYNRSFWVKIITLPFAILFTFGVRERVARDETLKVSGKSRAIALLSMALWLVVAAAGRWIGYS